MEIITSLISSVQTTLDSINKTIKYQPKSSSKTEKIRWERIKIADFRQYLINKGIDSGSYAEVSGIIWFGIEYDFIGFSGENEKFVFYSRYDEHLTIEIHITVDHPIAKIKIKS